MQTRRRDPTTVYLYILVARVYRASGAEARNSTLAVPLPVQAVQRVVLCLREEAVSAGIVVVDSAAAASAVAIVDAATGSSRTTGKRSRASSPARWLRSRAGVEPAARAEQAQNDPCDAWGWSSDAPWPATRLRRCAGNRVGDELQPGGARFAARTWNLQFA